MLISVRGWRTARRLESLPRIRFRATLSRRSLHRFPSPARSSLPLSLSPLSSSSRPPLHCRDVPDVGSLASCRACFARSSREFSFNARPLQNEPSAFPESIESSIGNSDLSVIIKNQSWNVSMFLGEMRESRLLNSSEEISYKIAALHDQVQR